MTIQDEAEALNKQAHRDECIQAMRFILRAKQEELKRHQQAMAVYELDMKELEDGVVPGRYQKQGCEITSSTRILYDKLGCPVNLVNTYR